MGIAATIEWFWFGFVLYSIAALTTLIILTIHTYNVLIQYGYIQEDSCSFSFSLFSSKEEHSNPNEILQVDDEEDPMTNSAPTKMTSTGTVTTNTETPPPHVDGGGGHSDVETPVRSTKKQSNKKGRTQSNATSPRSRSGTTVPRNRQEKRSLHYTLTTIATLGTFTFLFGCISSGLFARIDVAEGLDFKDACTFFVRTGVKKSHLHSPPLVLKGIHSFCLALRVFPLKNPFLPFLCLPRCV